MPELMPPIEVPGHAAFPSGHATESHLIARLLATVLPADHFGRPFLLPMAHRIAINREVLGLHYRSDSVAGEVLAKLTYRHMLKVAGHADDVLDHAETGLAVVEASLPGKPNLPRCIANGVIGETLKAALKEWD